MQVQSEHANARLGTPRVGERDTEIGQLIELEERRQAETLRLIPSENYASPAVLSAVGSILNNNYSEGYPGRRYYEGQKYVDEIENLAIGRARKLFPPSTRMCNHIPDRRPIWNLSRLLSSLATRSWA